MSLSPVAVDADEKRRPREDNEVEIPEEIELEKPRLESLFTVVNDIFSTEGNLQLIATKKLGILLPTETSPPIEEVTKSRVVLQFVEFLMREDFPQLQVEAAKALTEIFASGTPVNTRVVITNGAVPNFVRLLGSLDGDVLEQAVRALGNIAGHSSEYRDHVLSHEALSPLLTLLNKDAELPMQRNATKALSNFCKGKPQPVFEQVSPALPVLVRLLNHTKDEEVLIDACWALSYLSEGSNDKIHAVIQSNVCGRLVVLLQHSSRLVVMLALRTVRNLMSGDYTYILAVKNAGALGSLVDLLQAAELDIKREAALAISKAAWRGLCVEDLVKLNCIQPLSDLLECKDSETVIACLDALESILVYGEAMRGTTGDVNICLKLADDAGGIKKIQNLGAHDNPKIREYVNFIWGSVLAYY